MKKSRSINTLPENAVYDEMDSPVGILTIIASVKGLHAVLWDIDRDNARYEKLIATSQKSENDETIIQTKKQLTEYFSGARKKFDLPLVLNGTDFQIQA